MGFFSKRTGAASAPAPIDPNLSDPEWLSASRSAFEQSVNSYYGTPETMASGGLKALDNGRPGVALFFFQKSLDILHTLYGFSDMQTRTPSSADGALVDYYLAALIQTRGLRPDVDLADSVREVTHRLRSISNECKNRGFAPNIYLSGLDALAQRAPEVNVDDVLWT